MGSDAVSLALKSRIVGYKITKGNFATVSPNLPQRVVILGEANDANQNTLVVNQPTQITSAKDAGDNFGYGSPIYLMARILFPKQGGGISGIPVFVYPQAAAGGSTTKALQITPTGVANNNGTHTIVLSGREGLDGQFYDINIIAGDTTADITQKISDALNNVLGCPVIGTEDDYTATLTSKWKGLTANSLNVTINTNGDDLGISYAVISLHNGSGTPSISAALNQFGANWNTIVINGYGTNASIMNALEQFNGIPDPTNPTGRFVGIIMKPFIALTGSVADNESAVTDARKTQVTIAICPAPLSPGFQFEAAANACALFALNSQNTPHLDIGGRAYPDMPTPTDIGTMSDYANRETYLEKGCSTVDLVSGAYVVQDFVTTYHPDGENPAQFAYCRNIMLDLNIRYAYYILEQIHVVDHVIANDSDAVNASNVIKPKQWVQLLNSLAADLTARALIVDPKFMTDSLDVSLSSSNPDRLETTFKYKRTGVVRIASTTAEAGFNFGNV
ncbi:MAG TPA: hypothetical protein VN922_19570 [Bacteroidia bacterium]|nr:hypothetical protein [Bacteroidia bacterium]